ncbi:F-box only protein 33 isoform X2 [Tribolium madens]|uniref:F-box only protein 33 isoform X2 n=1 Tax=Tribolium madens TaxID=41895 RepID=UPI001CF72C78|nr:F-box only protein 33 isoform X2 [Tribolium madens]
MSIKFIRKSSDMNSDNFACFGDCPKPKKSKTSEEEHVAFWAHLPSIVIHDIFDLLSKNDRQNASCVCKNWRQNVFHPKWWPEITFKIEPCNIERAKFFTSVFGRIVSSAKIQVNTLAPECIDEFVTLIEALSENNNLKELIIEPTHCHFDITRCSTKSSSNMHNVIAKLKRCLPSLTKFSIGCIEDFALYLDEYLTILASQQPEKVTLLGLASVKDNPNEYEDSYFECDLIKPFTNLKVLSIDFDQLSDTFLACLDTSTHLERLVVHLHGVREGHPGTTKAAWSDFKAKHPNCELRFNVIHSYDEVQHLHETILKDDMPLTHLRVFFCENVNLETLEFISAFHNQTLRSLVWVDSMSNSEESWSFLASPRDLSPDPLVMMSWLCSHLNELVFYGYKYREENLVAIARLRGEKLKKLEIGEDDVLFSNSNYLGQENLIDIQLHLKQPWAPTKTADLHPVIRNPTAGDSDEYLLPIVLADLH